MPPSSSGAAFTPPTIEAMNAALPQYEFVELIGAGGMGAVYKALQPKLNRHVAIKILPPIPDDELGFTERFEREAQSMAQLSHPHIVSVYDFGETEDGHLYFVMEFIEGADLHQLITGGELTLDHFYGWIPQVCEAIQYAHDRGIVHRDIKPANILIDTEGRVKIADFGLAKLTGTDQPQTALTLADLSMGTPDYASPEQMEASSDIDYRSDIYSLGVVMYQMLTGKLPRGAYPMPSEVHHDIDNRLDQVVLKAMQTEPKSRFQHASEISDFLTRIRTTTSVARTEKESGTRPIKPAHRRQTSLLPIVGIVVAVSVVVGLLAHGIRKNWFGGSAEDENGETSSPTVVSRDSGQQPEKTPEKSPPKNASNGNRPTNASSPGLGKKPDFQANETDRAPRDFSRRQGQGSGAGGGRGPGDFEKFRDKLGKRPAQVARRNFANLVIIDRTGEPLEKAGILAEPPRDLKAVRQVVVGQRPSTEENPDHFVVALQADGKIRAWGADEFGQLEVPDSLGKVTSVAAGSGHVVALLEDGSVAAWGDDRSGQASVPSDLGKATDIAAGHTFSLALLEDGTVRAWGAAPFVKNAPGPEVNRITAIDAGQAHAVALRESGQVTVWGTAQSGNLRPNPVIGNVISVAATHSDTIVLTDEGRLVFAVVEDGKINGGNPSPQQSKEIGFLEDIYGAGRLLVARDREEKLTLYDGDPQPVAMPPFLRSLPREVELAIAGDLVFAHRPAPSSPKLTGETASQAQPNDTPPDPEPMPIPEASETEAGREIASLQEQFEEAYVIQVNQPWETSIAQLNEFYLNHLEQRQGEAAAASNLDAALVWRTEADGIRNGEALPEVDDPDLLPELLELRQTYRQKATEFTSARSLAENELLARFGSALQALQDRFTSEQKLDEALEVKTFRESRQ